MNLLAIVLTVGIIAGFGLLMYGAFFLKSDEGKKTVEADSEALEKMKLSVEEADTALSNINSVSSLIIEEIDIKYKELLFLYKMLEEKKKELLEQNNEHQSDYVDAVYDEIYSEEEFIGDEADSAYNANLEIMEIGKKMDEVRRFPRLHNKQAIIELYDKGYDITQIARELGVGRGEVKLILGLNRVGVGYE